MHGLRLMFRGWNLVLDLQQSRKTRQAFLSFEVQPNWWNLVLDLQQSRKTRRAFLSFEVQPN